jgi:hypothetical protein
MYLNKKDLPSFSEYTKLDEIQKNHVKYLLYELYSKIANENNLVVYDSCEEVTAEELLEEDLKLIVADELYEQAQLYKETIEEGQQIYRRSLRRYT